MNATKLLRKEVDAIDQCLANFLPPIPRKVVAVAHRKTAKVLVACPAESRAGMALAICEMLRRHHIGDDASGLLNSCAQQMAAPASVSVEIAMR